LWGGGGSEGGRRAVEGTGVARGRGWEGGGGVGW